MRGVLDQQQRRGQAEGKAQREGEDRDLGVVGKQRGGEDGKARSAFCWPNRVPISTARLAPGTRASASPAGISA